MTISLELISTVCAILSLIVAVIALFRVNEVKRIVNGHVQDVSGDRNTVVGRDNKS